MDNLILYHGSRGGLDGPIKPASRERLDFGKGFYMGTRKDQVITLVANSRDPYYYELKLDIESIPEEKILELKDMEWAFFVLYNRGRLETVRGSEIYGHYSHLADNKDLIIGPIADDAMNEVMNSFIQGSITDKAFLECIRGLDYGYQYVAKTEDACSYIEILKKTALRGQELQRAVDISKQRREEGHTVAETMQKLYRREGRYLDELLNSFVQEEEYCL